MAKDLITENDKQREERIGSLVKYHRMEVKKRQKSMKKHKQIQAEARERGRLRKKELLWVMEKQPCSEYNTYKPLIMKMTPGLKKRL